MRRKWHSDGTPIGVIGVLRNMRKLGKGRASPPDPARLEIRLPAVPASLPQVRRLLRRWLDAGGVSAEDADEIITACHEACANAIEHACGPADLGFGVDAVLTGDSVAVNVRDAGQWRPPHGARRGYGLRLMHALMDTVDIASGSDGTVVTMRRRVTRGRRR